MRNLVSMRKYKWIVTFLISFVSRNDTRWWIERGNRLWFSSIIAYFLQLLKSLTVCNWCPSSEEMCLSGLHVLHCSVQAEFSHATPNGILPLERYGRICPQITAWGCNFIFDRKEMLFHFTAGPMKTINWQMCLISEIERNYFEVHAYSSMAKGRLTHIRSPSHSPPCCGEKGPPLALQDTLHPPSGSRTTVLYYTASSAGRGSWYLTGFSRKDTSDRWDLGSVVTTSTSQWPRHLSRCERKKEGAGKWVGRKR